MAEVVYVFPVYDYERNCKKCGQICADVKLAYDMVFGEVMIRTCVDCGYSWLERPLDWKGEVPGDRE